MFSEFKNTSGDRVNTNFKVIGHRGAAMLEPENTLRSFTRAVHEGVDGIEFDVQLIDGRVLVLHDECVDRTSNGCGPAHSFTFETIRKLDFGLGEQIPTLSEAIFRIPSSVLVNVELKSAESAGPTYEVLEHFSSHEFLVSSFRTSELEEFANLAPLQRNLNIGLLRLGLDEGDFSVADKIGARTLCLCDPFVQEKTVIDVRSRGYDLYVYTVNCLNRARELLKFGASGVITDSPNKISHKVLYKEEVKR